MTDPSRRADRRQPSTTDPEPRTCAISCNSFTIQCPVRLRSPTGIAIYKVMALKTESIDMSTLGLEKDYRYGRTPAEKLLMTLKMHGSRSAADLGKQLGITGEAARQQLVRLADSGLVAATSEAKGVGRPTQLWHLTDEAHSRFPDTHASLTANILEIVRSHLGVEALETIIDAREAETRARYKEGLANKPDLRDRVSALAKMRSEEGYMADWSEAEDGSFLLIENHCPICAAAATCVGFCRAELDVFQKALGPDVSVTRLEHMLDGGRRCTYSIRQGQAKLI